MIREKNDIFFEKTKIFVKFWLYLIKLVEKDN